MVVYGATGDGFRAFWLGLWMLVFLKTRWSGRRLGWLVLQAIVVVGLLDAARSGSIMDHGWVNHYVTGAFDGSDATLALQAWEDHVYLMAGVCGLLDVVVNLVRKCYWTAATGPRLEPEEWDEGPFPP
jgi:hypothetical protein